MLMLYSCILLIRGIKTLLQVITETLTLIPNLYYTPIIRLDVAVLIRTVTSKFIVVLMYDFRVKLRNQTSIGIGAI